MIALLVGVPGAGKTTLCRYLEQAGLALFSASGETKKTMLSNLNIRKHLSEMNQTESILVNTLYFNMLDRVRLSAMTAAKVNSLLIDTHATYPLPDGSFVNLLPPKIEYVEGVILLEANARTILARRKARGRNKDSIQQSFVEYELRTEHMFAQEFADRNKLPFLAIDNTLEWRYDTIIKFIENTVLEK